VQPTLSQSGATCFFIELTARDGLDVVDGTEEPGFAEILKEERAKLLVVHGTPGEIGVPMLGIADSGRRLRRYTADFAADPTERAPLIIGQRMSPPVKRDAGDGRGIEEGFNVRPEPDKGPCLPDEFTGAARLHLGSPLADKEPHPIHIGKESPFHHGQREIGIDKRPPEQDTLGLLFIDIHKPPERCAFRPALS
jgi:hypothetical protein